jgi:hypothetical protein
LLFLYEPQTGKDGAPLQEQYEKGGKQKVVPRDPAEGGGQDVQFADGQKEGEDKTELAGGDFIPHRQTSLCSSRG